MQIEKQSTSQSGFYKLICDCGSDDVELTITKQGLYKVYCNECKHIDYLFDKHWSM